MIIYYIGNNITKMGYVGLSTKPTVDIRYRGDWSKRTHNRYLKYAVEFYGKENFTVKILESNVPSREELGRLEKYYIKELNTLYPNGYNFEEGGYIQKGMHQITRDKIAETNKKKYTLVNYKGEKIEIENLSKFCKSNGLNYGAMLNMVSGVNYSSQGYALWGADVNLINNPNQQYMLEGPDGTIYHLINKEIPAFCKRMGIDHKKIRSLLRSKIIYSE